MPSVRRPRPLRVFSRSVCRRRALSRHRHVIRWRGRFYRRQQQVYRSSRGARILKPSWSTVPPGR